MTVEFRLARPGDEKSLVAFFGDLVDSGASLQFHPHPLDAAQADAICSYSGADAHYVALDKGCVIAYGLLRGWDAGFSTPSLGIAVHPKARGEGLGRTLMEILHLAARRNGADQVRLRVYPDNEPALRLYRSLGYVFKDEEEGQLVGVLELG